MTGIPSWGTAESQVGEKNSFVSLRIEQKQFILLRITETGHRIMDIEQMLEIVS
jgi:hypothetical protein